jgi:hypothetical protein
MNDPIRQQRIYAAENLMESDADYVVDVLDITSEELMLAFPEKVRHYLDTEIGSVDDPEEEE